MSNPGAHLIIDPKHAIETADQEPPPYVWNPEQQRYTPRTTGAHHMPTAYTQQDSRAPLEPISPPAEPDLLLVWAKQLSQEQASPRVHLTIDQRHYLYQRGHLVATSRRRDG